jgi:hypothetical protein
MFERYIHVTCLLALDLLLHGRRTANDSWLEGALPRHLLLIDVWGGKIGLNAILSFPVSSSL